MVNLLSIKAINGEWIVFYRLRGCKASRSQAYPFGTSLWDMVKNLEMQP